MRDISPILETTKMTTIISPNLRKTSDKINANGDIIDKGGNVLKPNVPDFVPTIAEIQAVQNKPVEEAPKTDKIAEMINAKVAEAVEKIITKKIEEALKNL